MPQLMIFHQSTKFLGREIVVLLQPAALNPFQMAPMTPLKEHTFGSGDDFGTVACGLVSLIP